MHALAAIDWAGLLPGPTWPWILGGLLLALYLLAPLLIWLNVRMSARPVLAPLTEDELPADVLSFLARETPGLIAQGFEPACHFSIRDMVAGQNQVTYMAIHLNRAAGDAAAAYAVQVRAGQATTVRTVNVEFSTDFEGGRSVDTGNTTQLPSFRWPEEKQVAHFPHIRDAARLYELHRARCSEHGRGAAKVLPAPGTEGDRLLAQMVHDFEAQAMAGFMQLDPDKQVYSLTVKGAYLMTWKQLPPVSTIRKALLRAKAKSEEKRLLGA